jgi:hypothetical protein
MAGVLTNYLLVLLRGNKRLIGFEVEALSDAGMNLKRLTTEPDE